MPAPTMMTFRLEAAFMVEVSDVEANIQWKRDEKREEALRIEDASSRYFKASLRRIMPDTLVRITPRTGTPPSQAVNNQLRTIELSALDFAQLKHIAKSE